MATKQYCESTCDWCGVIGRSPKASSPIPEWFTIRLLQKDGSKTLGDLSDEICPVCAAKVRELKKSLQPKPEKK